MKVMTWAFCPTVGCGWRWAVMVDSETNQLAEGEVRYCAMCSTDATSVLGIVIPPDEKNFVEAVSDTGTPVQEESALLTDLLLMVSQRSPNLKFRRFLFAGQPAGVLYEHVNPEGTFGRIRPIALLLTPALLKALRPPKDWLLQPATITLTDQTEKGETDDE